jgi:methionyl-tRNA formyltransferase
MYRIVFFGTPKIASVCLKALIDSKNEIVGVVSQPDRLVDKNKKVIFSEVKQVAIENNLFLMQPEKVSEAKQKIKDLKPDIIITCAYGNLIPSSILDIPKFKCVNFHTSLLPKYRGGAPIHHAILNMEKETGLTIMYMDKGMDNGDIIKQFPVIITENTTYSELYEILSKLIYEKCLENIDYLCTTHVYSVKQNENLVSFAPIIKRENEKIN